jgi:acyl carrier protein
MAEIGVKEIEGILIEEVASILSLEPSTVTVDTPFQALGMSSLAFVELLVVIEDTLDLKLMETDLRGEDFRSIGSLAVRISRMK